MAAQAPPLAAHVRADLIDGVRREVGETAVLEIAPEQLHRVEVGRVGREPNDRPARMPGQPRPNEFVLVRGAAIPDQDDGPADVTREMAEKPQHLGPADVQPGVQRQGERDLAAARRDDERAHAGDLFMGAGAYGERRRGAARRPRAPKHRHHQEAGLIEADQVGAPVREFFLPGPSPDGSTRARGDRRAPSRAAGGAAD